ncbi:MAG: DNA polymerase III subunit alpha [Candidatus Nanopelagicales bacterium]|nr:DNA polymerase III subunit alpha [Candidatus Nanopelagicales bacterium]
MSLTWPHLRVASSYSLQYGTATPQAIVERAAADGHRIIALTDRDGVYGAVQWVQACQRAGITPVVGVDLAVVPVHAAPVDPRARRTPARGGAWVAQGDARMVFLARGRTGWASLCRLISAAHANADTHGAPMLEAADVLAHRAGLVALLGPDSELGSALLHGQLSAAAAVADHWRALMGGQLAVAIGSHRTARTARWSTVHAARLWSWARERQLRVVLTHGARYLEPADAATADILDAARQLVPLRSPRLVANTGEAVLDTPEALDRRVEEIAQCAGIARALLHRDTWTLIESCALDPERDLGLGSAFVPELDVLTGVATEHPDDEVQQAHALLTQRCRQAIPQRYAVGREQRAAAQRLDAELHTIGALGFAGFFLTVTEVVDLITSRRVRVAARGSGAGSLVNYLLGISGVDPMAHGLVMERFLSTLRRELPDIDIDVESARRLEIYDWIYERFGPTRVACVSMMETYRVRHAIRDVGAAHGLPADEIDAFAKAFPHIRARNARAALAELPELRRSRFGSLAAEGRLDAFLARVEALDGLPRHVAMHPCGVLLSDLSLLDRTPVQPSAAGYPMSQFDKDDVEHLGLLKLDVLGVRMQSSIAHAVTEVQRTQGLAVDLAQVPLDDPDTYALIQSTRTLGCFQIESPGQRELIGKFGPQTFNDLIIDISLFRPGPVKSDMIMPFLRARQGWSAAAYVHEDLRGILEETEGVVVFHEQVMRIVATMTGCSLAQADETRRSMNTQDGIDEVRTWFYPTALRRGYTLAVVEQVWDVLRSFASFGFCKAHAAAFALPTYQSAWLKVHHPAAFYAGILTHDPGMYPKRLMLDDARLFDIAILGIDINASTDAYCVEACAAGEGVRVPLTEVKGISDGEVARLLAGQPYHSLADAWSRASISRPVAEHLVLTGAFDRLYGIDRNRPVRHRGQLTRRDLLLQLADLDRRPRGDGPGQLLLDLGDDPASAAASGLPEMTISESVRTELDVLGLDVSRHVIEFFRPMLDDLGVTRAASLLDCRSEQEVYVAGVKVATQTPPIRTGKRVVFLTVDDATGPADATFFEDAQVPYAGTVFSSWLLLVRGHVRRTGPRGVSIRATGAWELGAVHEHWKAEGAEAVRAFLAGDRAETQEGVGGRVLVHASGFRVSPYADVQPAGPAVKLWHSSPGSSGW